MKPGYLSMQIELDNNGLAELCGPDIKYWAGEGLPTYEGSLDGFAKEHPAVMQELLDMNAVKQTD